jgi:DNA-directed RNA polymerase subunit RPC12/RpoP
VTSQVCARCQKPTREPVVVAIGHGASAGGGTVYACTDCAPTFPKQRDPFGSHLARDEPVRRQP